MTFNVDYTGIANWESVVTAPDGNLCAATLALQWAMLPMGYNRITAATVEDVVMRFRVWKALIGEPTAYMNGEPYWPTVDDVIRHIGLQSNATPMTWPQFMKHAVAESIGTTCPLCDVAHDNIRRLTVHAYTEHGAPTVPHLFRMAEASDPYGIVGMQRKAIQS